MECCFPPEAKARMEQLVENLRTAYGQSIQELDWMSPATKAKPREARQFQAQDRLPGQVEGLRRHRHPCR